MSETPFYRLLKEIRPPLSFRGSYWPIGGTMTLTPAFSVNVSWGLRILLAVLSLSLAWLMGDQLLTLRGRLL